MSVTTFLSNETLWQTLAKRIKAARHVDAAIAYFGQGGAKLLPLRRGDRLVVDMSSPRVKAGTTDPREIEKLMKRGVEVFTRTNLHAKVVVVDNSVISGSANVSKRSQEILDEAGIVTNDKSAVRRAREFIDRICTEPVRPEYLEECKRRYRPPHMTGERKTTKRGQQRAKHAKLWIVNLRDDRSIPESEVERYERGERKAEELQKRESQSETTSFHWPTKPKMADELEFGDWIIQAIKSKDGTLRVHPPGQLLTIDSYVREAKSGNRRYVFHLEVPRRGETMTWKQFCRAAKSLLKVGQLVSPRTKPVRDIREADGLLGLWTPGGRVAKR